MSEPIEMPVQVLEANLALTSVIGDRSGCVGRLPELCGQRAEGGGEIRPISFVQDAASQGLAALL